MAVSSGPVFFLSPPIGKMSAGFTPVQDPILGPIPCILCGKGTPDDDRDAFLAVPKGSLYLQMDAADDAVAIFLKVDDSGAGSNDDWNSASMT